MNARGGGLSTSGRICFKEGRKARQWNGIWVGSGCAFDNGIERRAGQESRSWSHGFHIMGGCTLDDGLGTDV